MRTPTPVPILGRLKSQPVAITRRDLLRALCAALATAFTPLAADLRRLTCWRVGPGDLRFAGAG